MCNDKMFLSRAAWAAPSFDITFKMHPIWFCDLLETNAYCKSAWSQGQASRWCQAKQSEDHYWTKVKRSKCSSWLSFTVLVNWEVKQIWPKHVTNWVWSAVDTKQCRIFQVQNKNLLWAEVQHYSSGCKTNLCAISSLTSREKQVISGVAGAVFWPSSLLHSTAYTSFSLQSCWEYSYIQSEQNNYISVLL